MGAIAATGGATGAARGGMPASSQSASSALEHSALEHSDPAPAADESVNERLSAGRASPRPATDGRPPREPPRAPVLRVLPGVADSAGVARTMARELLGDGDPAVDTVMLLISELVTNAIIHTRSGAPGGTVTVALCPGPASVFVQVHDDGASSVPRVVPRPWRGQVNGRRSLAPATTSGNGDYAPSRSATSAAVEAESALEAPFEAEHGYGLVLVDALADSWGTIASPDGRVTWFRVSQQPRRPN